MATAFFDLDLTLLSANSGKLWVRRELALGQIRKRAVLQASVWLVQYKLGLAGLDIVARAIGAAAGTREDELRARTRSFYESQIRQLFRPGARAALKRHRSSGDQLVLLTSSTHLMAELVAEDLKLDAILCNRLETDADGVFTGRTVGPICYGPGKLTWAQQHCDSRGELLSACSFYTDSYADLPVLEVVGRPVVVNPDPRLLRKAKKRRWEIQDWGVPS